MSAPTISLSATASPGTQSVIDQQLGVGVYTPLTTGSPGGPGTMWLVGHRTSYGGVFNRVPFLKTGDPIDPAGIDPSSTSSLNLSAAGQSRANLVMVAIGRSGRIAIRVSGSTHVIVDVAGYYEPSASARDGRFVEVTAGRLLDTRTDATQDRVLANETITIDVDARAPQFPAAQASAVVLRVTAANSPTRGYITAWRTGVPRPSTSNVNLSAAGEIAGNLAIIPIGPDGAVQVYTSTDLDLTIDIVGYFTNANAAVDTKGMFVPVVPRRVLDTRGLPFLLGAGSVTTFDLLSPAAIVGPVHLVANVTSTRSLGHGFVAVANSATPASTGLSVSGGETRANLLITSEASAAMTHVFVSLPTHVVIDVTGYFTA